MQRIDIQQIPGFRIGHSQNSAGGTGCTAIVCDGGAVGGVDVRGSAPATRETDLLHPLNTVESVNCVLLSGGSAFGLAAADGAMAYLAERGIGLPVLGAVVPIVVGASLFDLAVGENCHPDGAMGYAALVDSEANAIRRGNVGAGTGASVGKLYGPARAMKGGLGVAAAAVGELQVGAIVAVNALGNVVDPTTRRPLAGLLAEDGRTIISSEEALYGLTAQVLQGSANTTIGCLMTNAKLTKVQANKVAAMAHDGYARVIYPVHTSADGDTIFALAGGEVTAPPDLVGTLAAEVMARAIVDAVLTAESAYGLPCASDLT